MRLWKLKNVCQSFNIVIVFNKFSIVFYLFEEASFVQATVSGEQDIKSYHIWIQKAHNLGRIVVICIYLHPFLCGTCWDWSLYDLYVEYSSATSLSRWLQIAAVASRRTPANPWSAQIRLPGCKNWSTWHRLAWKLWVGPSFSASWSCASACLSSHRLQHLFRQSFFWWWFPIQIYALLGSKGIQRVYLVNWNDVQVPSADFVATLIRFDPLI